MKLYRITSRDVPAVHAIEVEAFLAPLTKRVIYDYLMCPNRYGIVAKQGRKTLGFLLYTDKEGPVIIDRIAVAQSHRLLGIARDMIVSIAPARKIALYASEEDVRIHLFMKAIGFRATKVRPNYFRDGSTAYLFMRQPLAIQPKPGFIRP